MNGMPPSVDVAGVEAAAEAGVAVPGAAASAAGGAIDAGGSSFISRRLGRTASTGTKPRTPAAAAVAATLASANRRSGPTLANRAAAWMLAGCSDQHPRSSSPVSGCRFRSRAQ